MKLTTDGVQHIADLARIELTEKEKEKYTEELSAVLGFIERLSEVNTDNIIPTSQVTGLVNIARDDIVENCDEETRKKILNAAPMREGNYIKVKAVL
ncbi:Asp-tRNA(Asn)/Glu-tRNA(Gln) amidotransferase subunit GatC [Patescibacteria group bacterium]|nr:Asp-tRNA(Asn)/Glu-tRNA(Gln) amidotransferase subunit GatC [Patescibacteria group bacterium]